MKLRRVEGSLMLGSMVLAARLPLASQGEPKFSIQCQNLSAPEFSSLVSRKLGLSLVYIPQDPQSKLNLDLKNLSRAEIQAVLGRLGTVAVAARGVHLEPALSAVRVSLQATQAKA